MWVGALRSTWVMLNTLTRRLAKMPDEMRAKMEYLAPHPSRHAATVAGWLLSGQTHCVLADGPPPIWDAGTPCHPVRHG